MMLSVRDRPLADESFAGYLIRLADYNGRRTVKELVAKIGLDEKSSLFASHLQEMEHACQFIASMINYPAESLAKHFQDQFMNSCVFNETRKIRSLKLSQPRICTKCFAVADEPHIHKHWSLLPVTHCTKHSTALIDCCPACNKQLKWTFDLFRKCNTCGFNWHEYTTEISDIPLWQQEFEALFQSRQNELSDWLDSFCDKVIKSARPFDQYHETIEAIPAQTINIVALVRQAYESDLKLVEWPPEGFVKARRLKLRETLNYHVLHEGFAGALGIKSTDITSLVESSLVVPIYNSPVLRDMLFDIRDANMLCHSVPVIDQCPEGYIEVSAESRLLGLYDSKYGQLLGKVLNRAPVYRSAQCNHLQTIYIEKNQLINYLEQLLEESCCGHLPIHRVLRILRIPREELNRLIQRGTLRLGRHSCTANKIIGESVWKYIKGSPSSLARRQSRLAECGLN